MALNDWLRRGALDSIVGSIYAGATAFSQVVAAFIRRWTDVLTVQDYEMILHFGWQAAEASKAIISGGNPNTIDIPSGQVWEFPNIEGGLPGKYQNYVIIQPPGAERDDSLPVTFSTDDVLDINQLQVQIVEGIITFSEPDFYGFDVIDRWGNKVTPEQWIIKPFYLAASEGR